jgi:predicted nucleic acid-binding protein
MPENRFYIDGCILLGTVIKDENTRACNSFISRIQNDIFIGYISSFVTGEMFNSIIYGNDKSPHIKYELLHAIVDIIITTKLNNFVPSSNDMNVYSELRKADYRISESDLMHIICAKVLDIPLVTTDNKMLDSQGLKKHVEIIYPGDV